MKEKLRKATRPEKGQRGLSEDKKITRRAVSVVFALTVNPFSSQTEYTSLEASGRFRFRARDREAGERAGAYSDIHSR